MQTVRRLAFLGAGHMARALALGLKQAFPELVFSFYSPSGSAKKLAEEVGGVDLSCPKDVWKSDIVFLAFRPQQLPQAEKTLRLAPKDSRVVSLLAGVSLEKLRRFQLGCVSRWMPNLSCANRCGVTLAVFDQSNSDWALLNRNLAEGLGAFYVVDSDDQLATLTAYSGSGPGLLSAIVRLFASELRSVGLFSSDQLAQTFLLKSFESSLKSCLDHSDLLAFEQSVASKGGITEACLQELEQRQDELKALCRALGSVALKKAKDLEK